MANIQKGTVGVIWGIGTMTCTGTAVGTHQAQSADFSREGEDRSIRGLDANTVCRVLYDPVDKLSYEIVPTGATKAAAVTANVLPFRGDDITVTSGTLSDTQIGGIGGLAD